MRTQRASHTSTPLLVSHLDDYQSRLLASMQQDLDALEGTNLHHISKKIKTNVKDFVSILDELYERYIKMGSKSQAQETFSEKIKLMKTTKQYLDMINMRLRELGECSMSNIDVQSNPPHHESSRQEFVFGLDPPLADSDSEHTVAVDTGGDPRFRTATSEMLAGAISSVEWGEPCVSSAPFGCGSVSLPSSSIVWAIISLSSLNFTRSSNLNTSTTETPNLLFSAAVRPKSSVAF